MSSPQPLQIPSANRAASPCLCFSWCLQQPSTRWPVKWKPDNRQIHIFIEKTEGKKGWNLGRNIPMDAQIWVFALDLFATFVRELLDWNVCESVPNVLRYDGMRIVGFNTCLEHLGWSELLVFWCGFRIYACILFLYIWIMMDPAKEGLHKPSTCSSLRCKSILKTTCIISDV